MASGYCIRKAPTVFGADDSGWVTLLNATAGGHAAAAVLEAAAACPVAAIDVFDHNGHQL
jgi:ferredoxin